MVVMPACGDIESNIVSEFDNVTYVKVVEYDGEYLIGLKTTPFFGRSQKIAFERSVISFIHDRYGINSNNVRLVFDLDILYALKHAITREDVGKIMQKVS